jgi:plasmid stabilization system protein ParE
MGQFEISLTSKALSDVDKLRFAIVFKYRAPLTAKRYLKGLNETIRSLKIGADSIQIDEELSKQYGLDIRRINYKEMAILYTVEGQKVYILRIMPQSLIVF